MIRQKIYDDMKQAMKDREVVKLDTLRFVWSEIKNAEIDAKHELNDDEVVALLQKEVKKRKEAIEQFNQGDRKELADEETAKLQIIEEYMPEMMSGDDIEKVIQEIVDGGVTDFGAVMGQAMGKLKGKADGKVVAEVVKETLSSS